MWEENYCELVVMCILKIQTTLLIHKLLLVRTHMKVQFSLHTNINQARFRFKDILEFELNSSWLMNLINRWLPNIPCAQKCTKNFAVLWVMIWKQQVLKTQVILH